jgi:hypothetical protein
MRLVLFTGILIFGSLPVLALSLDNDTYMTIDQDRTLYVDGVALTLNAQQQSWVVDYYDGINQAAPQAAAIASEAIALANLDAIRL